MVLKKNKKAQLMPESILAIVSIVVVGVSLFFISSMIGSVNANFKETSPQLNYEFPATFVYTFLWMPITNEDKLAISNQNINFVKDLIWLNNEDSKILIEKYKSNYIDSLKLGSQSSMVEGSNLFTLYSGFSKNTVDENNLLVIDYSTDKNNLADFNNLVSSNNFMMPIRTKNGDFTLVRFLG